MREDDQNQLTEDLARELLDAAGANYRNAEPRAGLDERVLANLRRQSRAARPVSWNMAPVMIAVAAVAMLFAVDHLIYHPAASDPAIVAVSGADEPHGGVESNPIVRQAKAGEREVVDGAKKAAAASKWETSSSRRQDMALNLNSRRADERAESGFRVEEVRITEVRLDDIVLGNNERQE